MEKARKNKSKKINISEISEDLSIYESGTSVEELSCSDIESDCITEGGMIDDGNIIFVNAIKKDGQAVLINKSIKWVMNALVKDSSYIKRLFCEKFGSTILMPLPLGLRRVFIPIKVRRVIGANDGSFGYIGIRYIEDIVKFSETVIKLNCGTELICLESAKTVKNRVNSAKLMEEKLSSLLTRERGSKEGIADYERAATKGDINLLIYEIMKLRDKIEKD